jgi:hypothetical protein
MLPLGIGDFLPSPPTAIPVVIPQIKKYDFRNKAEGVPELQHLNVT